MWQPWVEIKHYSISTVLLRSKCCSAVFPLRAGLIHAAKLHQCLISLHSAMSPALNRSSALQHFKRGNMVKIRNGMFDFYPGLPHIYRKSIEFLTYMT